MKKKSEFKLTAVKPSPLDERDINFHLTRFVSTEEPLPDIFEPIQTPVRNQGRNGSCVGFASAAALEFANNMKEVITDEIGPIEKEIHFRSFVVDGSLPGAPRLKKKVFVLIDGIQEYWGETPGIIACKVLKSIISKGPVKVQVWAEGYNVVTHLIDFINSDESIRTVLRKGKDKKPEFKSDLDSIEPEEEIDPPEPEDDIILDNVKPDILPKKKTLIDKLIDWVLSFFGGDRHHFVASYVERKILSAKFMYSKAKEINENFEDTGTFPKNACVVSKDNGCVVEGDLPYAAPIPEDLRKRDADYDSFFNYVQLMTLAMDHRIESYHRLYTPEEVKRALHNGMGVFFAARDAQLLTGLRGTEFPKYRRLSGWSAHAMAFVGWNTKGVTVKNSWGSIWGNKGYARIPYGSEWWSSGIFEIWALKIRKCNNGRN